MKITIQKLTLIFITLGMFFTLPVYSAPNPSPQNANAYSGNQGVGVGNTGIGNQGNGPNQNTAGRAGGNMNQMNSEQTIRVQPPVSNSSGVVGGGDNSNAINNVHSVNDDNSESQINKELITIDNKLNNPTPAENIKSIQDNPGNDITLSGSNEENSSNKEHSNTTSSSPNPSKNTPNNLSQVNVGVKTGINSQNTVEVNAEKNGKIKCLYDEKDELIRNKMTDKNCPQYRKK